jgi:hypothetical protein
MNNHWKENSERNTICHRKKLTFKGRNCDRKRPPVTVRNLLSQEATSCCTKKHLKIGITIDEHNAEEEIAENLPLLQNAYKILKNTMNNHWKENSN